MIVIWYSFAVVCMLFKYLFGTYSMKSSLLYKKVSPTLMRYTDQNDFRRVISSLTLSRPHMWVLISVIISLALD